MVEDVGGGGSELLDNDDKWGERGGNGVFAPMSHRIETVETGGVESSFTSFVGGRDGVVPLDVRMRANNSVVVKLVAGVVKWSMVEEKVPAVGRKSSLVGKSLDLDRWYALIISRVVIRCHELDFKVSRFQDFKNETLSSRTTTSDTFYFWFT